MAVTITTSSLPTGCSGVLYSQVLVADNGIEPYIWASIDLPDGIVLGSTGEISGSLDAGTYEFTVSVTDANNDTDSVALTLVIHQTPLIDGPDSIETDINTQVTLQYAATADSSVTWEIQTGELPSGMLLSNGFILGIPTVSGVYEFTLIATDDFGCVGQLPITLRVQRTLHIQTQFLEGCVNHIFTVQLSVANGVGPFQWQIIGGDLPPGLILNQLTGVISGVPLLEGVYPFTVQVLDLHFGGVTEAPVGFVIYDQNCAGTALVLPRIISLPSSPIVVIDPAHQETLFNKIPTPLFNLDREMGK